MQVFIDTNVLLNFYSLSNDELIELRKIIALIDNRTIRLIMPEQVVDEFKRNRDSKIGEAVKKLQDNIRTMQFPVMCRDYSAYQEARSLHDKLNKCIKSLKVSLLRDSISSELKADHLIEDLLARSTHCKRSSEIVEFAESRVKIGNPPGKGGSLGDAINWEILLFNAEVGVDLCLIADDKDYFSTLDSEQPNSFLNEEWHAKVRSGCYFYRSISNFLCVHFPDIKIASEIEVDAVVSKLLSSSSKEVAREAIQVLGTMEAISSSNVNYILDAFLDYKHVKELLSERDIAIFLANFSSRYRNSVSKHRSEEFDLFIKPMLEWIPAIYDDIPF